MLSILKSRLFFKGFSSIPASRTVLNPRKRFVSGKECTYIRPQAGRKGYKHPPRNELLLALLGTATLAGCAASSRETPDNIANRKAVISELETIVGKDNVVTKSSKMTAKTKGMRVGSGKAEMLVFPGTIDEAIRTLQAVVDGGYYVICQGRNTGLTGGSVPNNERESRKAVIISMDRLSKITPIDTVDGVKMLCMAGSGIADLSKECATRGRESHSTLGSIFLNPTVGAGVSFGSGGTQVRKGPAYTERALYARVDSNGCVVVCDDTGLKADTLDELYRKIESGDVKDTDLDMSRKERFWCSSYPRYVTNLNGSVSRYNADPISKTAVARSEGKVMVLATIHHTFPAATKKCVRWLACDDMDLMEKMREKVALGGGDAGFSLPASFEYMNRDSVIGTLKYSKVGMAIIRAAGMKALPPLYALQKRVDSIVNEGLSNWVQFIGSFLVPTAYVCPKSIYKDQVLMNKKHHLLFDASDYGNGELAKINERLDLFMKEHGSKFICKTLVGPDQGKANMIRFNMASAFKIMSVVKGCDAVCLDYAMPKNHTGGVPPLAEYPEVKSKWVYSHFGCYVVHHDLAVCKKANAAKKIKDVTKHIVESQNGKLPSEHGMGQLYPASKEAAERLQAMDPMNVMNPGVGLTNVGIFYGNKKNMNSCLDSILRIVDGRNRDGLINCLKFSAETK